MSSARLERLLDHMFELARPGDAMVSLQEPDGEGGELVQRMERTEAGATYVEGRMWPGYGGTGDETKLSLDDARVKLRSILAGMPEAAWQRGGKLDYLAGKWITPASGIWRSDDRLLACNSSGYVLIDATGAIVRRFDIRRYVLERGELRTRDDDELVLSYLAGDDDPDTVTFVRTVLGDAAVMAEEEKG